MAEVPYNDGIPSVSPDSRAPDDYQRIQADPSSFGAQIAKGVEHVGGGLDNASNAFFDSAQFRGRINVDDQTNHFITEHNKILYGDPSQPTIGPDGQQVPDTGFMGLQGRSAADNREDALKRLEDIRKAGAENLKSPQEKLQYDEQTRRMLANTTNQIGTHSEQQWKGWAAGVNGSTADHSLNGYVNSPPDSEAAKNYAGDYVHAKVGQAQIKFGFDPTIEGQVAADAKRDLLKARTDRMAINDPAAALKDLEKNKEIAGTQYDEMYGKLRARSIAQTGDAVGAAGIAKAKGGNFAPTTTASIQTVSARYGISPGDLGRAVQIESGGNPKAQTGSYKGLLQLSQSEFDRYKPRADASIWNAQDNLEAGAAKMRAESDQFQRNFGRPATGFDSYMIHQQGLAGYSTHIANPNAPAWQNMLSTGEGREKGEAWARKAIWGNVPDQYKASFGNVDNITSRDFIAMWAQKYGGGASPSFAPGGGSVPAQVASAPDGSPVTPASFDVRPAFNESRGNFETANFPQPNVASSIRANAYQHVLDDPRAQGDSPEAVGIRTRALAVVQAQLKAEALAEDQNTQTRKLTNDLAADEHTRTLGKFETSSNPDYVGLDKAINEDPRLDFKTRHELREWVSTAAGGHVDRTWGPGYWDMYKQVHAPDGDPGKITDPSQVYGMVRPGGPLTPAGGDKILAEIAGSRTPHGLAELQMKKDFLEKVARPQIVAPKQFQDYDPKGEAKYLGFLALFDATYDAAKAKGTTGAQLLDPESKDYVGKLIDRFKPTGPDEYAQRMKDATPPPGFFSRAATAIGGMLHSADPAPAPFDTSTLKTPKDVRAAYDAKRLTYDEAARLLSGRFGLGVAPAAPQVPNTP